jgi:hypothetical protein
MTEYLPQKKSVKYFFGYYDLFGQAAPMMWAEEDGIVVGGIPKIIERYEISEDEFRPDVHLKDLCQKYPIRIDMTTIFPKDTETDLT